MNCITFENDQHTVEPGQKAQKGGAQELWSNPNYFMEVKKGASEDHAILLANLFLSILQLLWASKLVRFLNNTLRGGKKREKK